jgi:hypothetical protein
MTDPKRAADTRPPDDPSEPVASPAGGFGAFSEAYRTRWAARHPNMVRRWAAHDPPAPSPSAAMPDAESAATNIAPPRPADDPPPQ